MKKIRLALPLACALLGCQPDVTVSNVVVAWNETNKKASAEIKNIGDADAGQFLVYFNAEENPISMNHRPQISHTIPGLPAGASITLHADFAPLAHPDNANLANVYKIVVLADPKGMLQESNENNNTGEAPLAPTQAVVDQHNLVPEGNYVVENSQNIAQTFRVSQTGRLVGIEVAVVRCDATTTDVLAIEVGQGTTSLGTASITGAGMLGPGQCGVVPAALTLTSTGAGYFDLDAQAVTLNAGPTYYFKLTNAATRDFRVGLTSDLYADGTAHVNDVASPTKDLAFKILIMP